MLESHGVLVGLLVHGLRDLTGMRMLLDRIRRGEVIHHLGLGGGGARMLDDCTWRELLVAGEADGDIVGRQLALGLDLNGRGLLRHTDVHLWLGLGLTELLLHGGLGVDGHRPDRRDTLDERLTRMHGTHMIRLLIEALWLGGDAAELGLLHEGIGELNAGVRDAIDVGLLLLVLLRT